MTNPNEAIPPEVRDSQQYWLLPGFREATCPECGTTSVTRPRVIFYRIKTDESGVRQGGPPDWPDEGWLVWQYCPNCPVLWKDTIASDKDILEWIKPPVWENIETGESYPQI